MGCRQYRRIGSGCVLARRHSVSAAVRGQVFGSRTPHGRFDRVAPHTPRQPRPVASRRQDHQCRYRGAVHATACDRHGRSGRWWPWAAHPAPDTDHCFPTPSDTSGRRIERWLPDRTDPEATAGRTAPTPRSVRAVLAYRRGVAANHQSPRPADASERGSSSGRARRPPAAGNRTRHPQSMPPVAAVCADRHVVGRSHISSCTNVDAAIRRP